MVCLCSLRWAFASLHYCLFRSFSHCLLVCLFSSSHFLLFFLLIFCLYASFSHCFLVFFFSLFACLLVFLTVSLFTDVVCLQSGVSELTCSSKLRGCSQKLQIVKTKITHLSYSYIIAIAISLSAISVTFCNSGWALQLFCGYLWSFPPQVKDFGAPHGLYAMVAVLRFLLLGEKVATFYHQTQKIHNLPSFGGDQTFSHH